MTRKPSAALVSIRERVTRQIAGGLWRRTPKVLHVFLSSPGECAVERDALRQVIADISNSEEARSLGIELRPLMWEDLPPGMGRPGDLQIRVDEILKRYGLQRYEIYLGMMKSRI